MIVDLPHPQMELVAKSSMTELKYELDGKDEADWQRVSRYARSLAAVADELAYAQEDTPDG